MTVNYRQVSALMSYGKTNTIGPSTGNRTVQPNIVPGVLDGSGQRLGGSPTTKLSINLMNFVLPEPLYSKIRYTYTLGLRLTRAFKRNN